MKLIKPKFWDKNYLTFQSLLLYPLTFIIDLRNLVTFFEKPKKYAQIKTICIGNIYLGGTGKTPLVSFLAKKLNNKFKTIIIKKKYQSHLDEKKMLEKNNEVLFDKNRALSLSKAIEKKFELAIFDDGLQDKKIEYDLKIACFNSISLAGNGLRLPSGPLRERLNNLRRYDAVFISGKPVDKIFLKKIKRINPKIKIFNGEYVPTNYKKFKKKKYMTFSGIGNPSGFAYTLNKYGIKSESNLIYPDHYEYSETEINKIKKLANKKKLKILTTEKDFCRIPIKLRKNISFLKIEIRINNLKKFNRFLSKYL